MNICDDPLLSGCLVYNLPKRQEVSMGSLDSSSIVIKVRSGCSSLAWVPEADANLARLCECDSYSAGF